MSPEGDVSELIAANASQAKSACGAFRDVGLESVMRGKADVTDLSEFLSSRALSGALHVLHRINVDPGTGFAGVQLHLICPTGKSVNFCLASGLSVQIFGQKNLAC